MVVQLRSICSQALVDLLLAFNWLSLECWEQ